MGLKRGDVRWVVLDPVVGSEIGKRRPAVVLQNEAANRSSATVTVVPLTTSLRSIYPFQVHIPAGEGGLEENSKAVCEQIRTVSRSRVGERLGVLGEDYLSDIRTALDRHLWL